MKNHFIICQKCKTENTNTDYCVKCNNIINFELKRKLEAEEKFSHIKKINSEREPSKIIQKIENLKNHNNIFLRIIGIAIYSLGLVTATIVTGIAAAIAGIAVG